MTVIGKKIGIVLVLGLVKNGATNNGQSRKYRVVVDNEELARQIAERLKMLSKTVLNAKWIAFDGLSSWMTNANSITIKKIECD